MNKRIKQVLTGKCFYFTNILVFVLILIDLHLFANPYKFQTFSTFDGLSHKMVNCIMQDRYGFIWVGTSDGLNRFDGYSFKKYYQKKQDSLSLQTNNVTAMSENSDGKIWMATGDGFYCYSPFNEAFYKIHFKNGKGTKLAEDICIDKNGLVWGVENTNTLALMNRDRDFSGTYIKLDSILGSETPLYNKRILSFEGYLWILSSQGIIRFDPLTYKAILIKSEVKFSSPRAIRKGNKGEIFAVDWNAGVFKVNTNSLNITPFQSQNINVNSNSSVGITDVLMHNDGSVWILKFPGLSCISASGHVEDFNIAGGYDKDYDKFVYFNSMLDNEGNIWLGTQDEGVIVVSRNENIFEHVSVANSQYKNLQASSFLIDSHNIFLGNIFGTFYSKNSENASLQKFSQITSGVTTRITKANKGNYLIFEKNKVLSFDPESKNIQTILETSNLQNGLVDSRGIIWVTHWEQGMEGYDPVSGKQYQIDVDAQDKSRNVVFTLLEDSDGSLWLGTFGTGLVHVVNPESETRIMTVYKYSNDINSLSNNFVTSLHDDGNGTLWIGTNGGGLNKFDKKTGKFAHFTTEDGLRSNVVQAILSDNEGNIWFSSNVITKFDPEEGTFTHFDQSDGVTSKYFTCHAQSTQDGTFYFGDDQGVLTFNPKRIIKKKIAVSPLFTGLKFFGQAYQTRSGFGDIVPLQKSITFSDTMILPYNLNSVSLEFACLMLPNNKNIIYSFYMEGVDNQWITTLSTERQAIYAGLPPGEYTFFVKASTGHNIWSEPRKIFIRISPPWWASTWFRLGSVIVLILIVSVLILMYINTLKRRNIKLEQLVQKRTDELQKANANLKDERLVVEMKNQHLNDVLKSKEKLINIIAHDFKGPLNGMLGFTQLIQDENTKSEKFKNLIEIISSSTKTLVSQMVSLLDWAQSEDEKLEAHPSEINPEILLQDAIMLTKTIADQKNIAVDLQNNSKSNILVDTRMGSMIFRNLLSNAIKFTPKGGSISVLANELSDKIEILFIDNGVGISQQTINELMTSNGVVGSTYGTENEKGSGFGLRTSKLFVEKNNGSMKLSGVDGQGTIVTIELPKGARIIEEVIITKDYEQPETSTQEHSYKNTVLIVDDNDETLKILYEILYSGYDIIKASNGREALHITLQTIPDIIITDIDMPELSGIELCEKLSQNKKTSHIPLILISSHNSDEIKNKAFAAGANDYIEKPFNTFQLLKKIESILSYKQKISEQTRDSVVKEVFPDLKDDFDSNLIKKVNQFVEENLNQEKLNTNYVASELRISRTHLWRKYKSETGLSLGDYIKERRLQKASAMLLTGKYRISDVAYDLGYSEPRNFSKWFTKECGVTPTQYMEKMVKG